MRTSYKLFSSTFIFLTILFLSITYNSYSKDYKKLSFDQKIEGLGSQPTHIIKTSDNNFEIFCLGKDLNFDGVIDEATGEEYSSWYRLVVVETTSIPAFFGFQLTKVYTFEDDIIQFGFRPVFDTLKNKIYLNMLKKVKILNVGNNSNSKIENEDLFAVQNFGKSNVVLDLFDGKLISTKYENFKSDSIRIFENNENLTFITSFSCGNNTLQANFQNNSILVTDQGTFGNSDSKIYSIDLPNYPSFDNPEIFVDSVGDGANDFYNEKINNYNIDYLVLNADNKIIVAKTDNDGNSSLFEYVIGEPKSFNGPRQVITNKDLNYFYVTTYDKKVYVFDKSFMESANPNLTPIDTLELDYSSESLAIYDSFNFTFTFVTTPFDGSYKAVNTIDIFRDNTKTSLDEIILKREEIKIYPNPVDKNQKLFIDFALITNTQNNDFNNYKIYSIEGKLLKEENITLTNKLLEINLDEINIQNGTYLLKLSNKDNISIIKKFIVK